MIDDILGLLVLAVVSSVAKGDVNVAGLVTTAVLAVGFTLLIALSMLGIGALLQASEIGRAHV